MQEILEPKIDTTKMSNQFVQLRRENSSAPVESPLTTKCHPHSSAMGHQNPNNDDKDKQLN